MGSAAGQSRLPLPPWRLRWISHNGKLSLLMEELPSAFVPICGEAAGCGCGSAETSEGGDTMLGCDDTIDGRGRGDDCQAGPHPLGVVPCEEAEAAPLSRRAPHNALTNSSLKLIRLEDPGVEQRLVPGSDMPLPRVAGDAGTSLCTASRWPEPIEMRLLRFRGAKTKPS